MRSGCSWSAVRLCRPGQNQAELCVFTGTKKSCVSSSLLRLNRFRCPSFCLPLLRAFVPRNRLCTAGGTVVLLRFLVMTIMVEASRSQAWPFPSILLLLLFLVLGRPFLSGVVSSARLPPNIVMFVIDDMGWNDMSFNGAEFLTPHVDALAEAGVRLESYYVQSLCSPSRAALMSSRYPFRDGLAHHVITNGYPFGMPLNHTTLADALRMAGYTTSAIGKWDLGMHEWEYVPTRRGFDTFYGFYDALNDFYTHEVKALSATYKMKGVDFRDGEVPVGDQNGVYSTALFTQRAERIITAHDFSEKPLFLYFAHQALHSPLEAPQAYIDQCAEITDHDRRIYCAMAKTVDDSVAIVVSALKARSVWNNTLFIFTTDNGGQTTEGGSNWPLRGNKRTVWEGGVRGLAFVHGPMLRRSASRSSALMHMVDWLPTLVEGVANTPLSALPGKMQIDGVNIWPALRDGTSSPRNEVVLNLDPPIEHGGNVSFLGQAAIRYNEWKLIVGLPNCSLTPLPPSAAGGGCPDGWIRPGKAPIVPPESDSLLWLFDVEHDPFEKNNLATAMPHVVEELHLRLNKYRDGLHGQVSVDFDPRSDPALHGGFWTPWLD